MSVEYLRIVETDLGRIIAYFVVISLLGLCFASIANCGDVV